KPLPRSGTGIPRRGNDGRGDQRPRQDWSPPGHFPDLGHAIQGHAQAARANRGRAERRRGGRGDGAPVGQPRADHRAIDPDHAGLDDTYGCFGFGGYAAMSPKEAAQMATAAALRALEIDDTRAEAHTALVAIHHRDWQWLKAEQEFKRAMQLGPSYAIALQL